MRSSIAALGDQVLSAWEGVKKLDLSAYPEVKNIVFSAMGGSGLGADFVRSVFQIKLPLQLVHEYKLPPFVGEDTLVIAASYSGTTEETIATLHDAIEKKARIVGLATGAKLAEVLKENNLPYYLFDTKYNPAGQPRMGSGFTIGSLLSILATLGLIQVSDDDIKQIVQTTKRANESFSFEVGTENNPAKQLAEKAVGKINIILSAEFLSGNAHVFTNQINENAKNFASYFLLSEANHHLLEGTRFPENLSEKVNFIFLESEHFSPLMKKRFDITKEVLEKAGIEHLTQKFSGNTQIEDAFTALVFSSWAGFYMSIQEGIDPSPIPTVDFFKDRLSK